MSRRHRWLIVFVLLAFALLAKARNADACECNGAGAPCQRFYEAPAVFVGTVQSITRLGPGANDGRRVHFVVTESFRGVGDQEIDIDTGRYDGDCAYPFKTGEAYFVYARAASFRDSPILETALCMRTQPLNDAAFDLSFARSAPGAPALGGVIFGSVGNLEQPLPGREVGDGGYHMTPGVAMNVACGNFVQRAETDARGRYVLKGLPVGECRVDVTPPSGTYVIGPPKRVTVPDLRACRDVPVGLRFDGRIRGRVLDVMQRPIAGLTVDAFKTSDPELMILNAVTTDENGAFEVARLPPGTYVVGTSIRPPSVGLRYGLPIYFPAVATAEEARGIALGGGDQATIGDFTLPQHVQFVHASGTVVNAEGLPVLNARVRVGMGGSSQPVSGWAYTDDQGHFTLAVARGATVSLRAELVRRLPDRPGNIDGANTALFVANSDQRDLLLKLVTYNVR